MSIRMYQMQDDWNIEERGSVSYSQDDDVTKNAAALKLLLAGRYRLTAIIDSNLFDLAFRLTQNGEHPWSLNNHPLVQVMQPSPEVNGMIYGLKSTEVGDLGVMDGGVYRCARTGWEYCGDVPPEKLASIPRRTACALLIDPVALSISSVTVTDMDSVRNLVGNKVEVTVELPNGDILYTNQEFLLGHPEHFYTVNVRGDFPLAGRSLLVGPEMVDCKDGTSFGWADVQSAANELAKRLVARSREEVMAWAKAHASDPVLILPNYRADISGPDTTVGQFFGVGPKEILH